MRNQKAVDYVVKKVKQLNDSIKGIQETRDNIIEETCRINGLTIEEFNQYYKR